MNIILSMMKFAVCEPPRGSSPTSFPRAAHTLKRCEPNISKRARFALGGAAHMAGAASRTSSGRLRHLSRVLGASPAAADATSPTELTARLSELQREHDAIQLRMGQLTAMAHSKDNAFNPPTGLSLDEIKAFFRINGFWCVPDAVSGEWLERVQACFREGQARARVLWGQAKAQRERLAYEPGNTGTGARDAGSEHHDLGEPALGEELAGRHARGYFDVPRFVEQDESLLRLLDNPNTLPIIEAVMGGRVQVNQIQARTVPAEVAHQYTSWHRSVSFRAVTHLHTDN